MKKRWLIPLGIVVLVLLVVWLEPTRVLWGTLRGEAFYRGRPTSYWAYLLNQQMEEEPEVVEWVSTGVDFPSRPPRLWDRVRDWFDGDGDGPAAWEVLAQEAAALPVLLELLQDDRRNVRHGAMDALQYFDYYPMEPRVESRRHRWEHQTGANPFTTVLGSAYLDVRRRAAVNLADMNSPEAATVVPELMDILRDGKHVHRITACNALAKMGPTAQAAVPLLQKLRDDQRDYKLRRAAWKALQQIAPDDRNEEPKL